MNIYQDSNNTISTILYAGTEENAIPYVLYKDKEQTKPISRKELHDLGLSGQILVSFTGYNSTYGYKEHEIYVPAPYFLANYALVGGSYYNIAPEKSFYEIIEFSEGFGAFRGVDNTVDVFGVGNSENIIYEHGYQDILTVYGDKIYGTVNCYIPSEYLLLESGASIALMHVYLFITAGMNEEDKVYGIDGKELYVDDDYNLCVYLGAQSLLNPNKMAYQKLNTSQWGGGSFIEIPFFDSIPKKDRKFEIKIKLADGSFQTTTYDCSNVNFTFSKIFGP